MATERVQITVTSSGTVTVKKEIDDIGDAGTKASRGVDLLKAAIAGIVTGAIISDLVKYGDQFTNLQNKLKLVTNGSADLATTTGTIARIADETYQSLDSVATVYQRVTQATGKLGLTQKDTNNFVEQFSKSVALSGASAESSAAAITQFTQGLGSGVLRGQDLLSVLDQLPYTAQAIATGLDTDVAGLRKLAEAGKLTPQQIIDAFNKVAPNIQADFAKLTPTLSQAFQVLDNQLTLLAGNAQGAFGLIAQGIVFVANNLPLIVTALLPVIAIFGVFAVQVIGAQFIGAVGSAISATTQLVLGFGKLVTYILVEAIPAFVSFTVALITNPFTIWLAGAVALAAAIAYIIDLIATGGKTFSSFADAALDEYNKLISALGPLGKALTGQGTDTTVKVDATKGLKDAAAAISSGASGTDAAKAITSATTAGAKDLTKGIDNGFDTSLDLLNSGITDGGNTAAKAMNAGIVAGGNTAADAMSRAVAVPGSSTTSAANTSTSSGALWNPFTTTITKPASTDLRNVPGTDAYNIAHQPGGSLYGQDGQYAVGGSFRVGGSGGTDSQTVSFRASPNERVTIDTPEQAASKANAANQNKGSGDVSVQAVNVLDGSTLLDALSTSKGKNVMVNNMKFNREEFRKVLGINT